MDGLDPDYTPGTGTPEIGGITTREALNLLRGLHGLNFVGADVVEVSPPFGPGGNRPGGSHADVRMPVPAGGQSRQKLLKPLQRRWQYEVSAAKLWRKLGHTPLPCECAATGVTTRQGQQASRATIGASLLPSLRWTCPS